MNNSTRVVLITGGSKGIGRAVTEKMLSEGYRVAATYRSGDVPAGALPIKCDITDQTQVDEAFKQVEDTLGPVEILVANAGITKDVLLARMSDSDWDSVIDTNLTGTFRVVRRASRTMMRKRFGRIILMSSVVGVLGSAGQVNYASSKSALIGMARSIARELGTRNITANVITPGFIQTDMTEVLSQEVIEQYKLKIPLGRLGAVEDIANAVQFLASDAANYINGAIIPVDGGLSMGH